MSNLHSHPRVITRLRRQLFRTRTRLKHEFFCSIPFDGYSSIIISSAACQQRRHFGLPQFPSSVSSLVSPGPAPERILTASRILLFPPLPLFRTIAAVENYAQFLPFLSESTVTARDPHTGYPTRAYLTVGFGPFVEMFESKVDCDKGQWTVGARSGKNVISKEIAKTGSNSNSRSQTQNSYNGNEAGGGLFEYLDTIWKLEQVGMGTTGTGKVTHVGAGAQTKVDLTVRFRFRSKLHAAIMNTVEDQVAGKMVEAFEKRVKEIGIHDLMRET